MIETGRGGALIKEYKDNDTKDIMREYFNHPAWGMNWGDPVPDMPLDVQLELVNRCNLDCLSCNPGKQKRKLSFLEWDTMKRIVDEAAEEGVAYFTICGIGEASMHPDLFKLFQYIRSKDVVPKGLRRFNFMPSVLISNGKWSQAQVDSCIENPPDLVSFSLAGITDEDIITRRKGLDLDKFIQNVDKIYCNRKVVREADGGLSPTIHISTHLYPDEMVNMKAEIEAFKTKFFPICDVIVIKSTEITPELHDHNRFIVASDDIRNIGYENISESHFVRTAPCFETSRRLSVDSDGNVWCGHHYSENFGVFLGNVKEQTLREIWHSEKMNKYRLQVRAGIFYRPLCQQCGGEIREFHKKATMQMEQEITFKVLD